MVASSLRQLVQSQAYRIVIWQLAGVIIIAAFALTLSGVTSGLSVLAGGLAYGFPNLVFVWRVFRFVGAQEMNRFVAAFFAGEALKLILSAILFLVIVKYLPVSLLSTLVGFVGAIISFWVVCIWQFSR
jgi:ATP synthase protein I